MTNEDGDIPSAPQPRREGRFLRFWRQLGGGSLTAAILFHAVLVFVATLIVLKTIHEPEKKVDFVPAGKKGGGGGDAQKQATRIVRVPPASDLKRVTAEGSVSSMVLPDPGDSFGAISSLGSLSGGGGLGGSGLGRGTGSGNGSGPGNGIGSGAGGLAGGTMFFNQEVKATRVAYVIDFSGSMRGKREKLMRKELAKSVSQLSPLMQFQLIFFSGPVWLAGDQVQMDAEHKTAIVTHDGVEYDWGHGKEPGSWEYTGKKPHADWLPADPAATKLAASQIKETPLQYGTHWVAPLEMALEMKPQPDVIFFMTDGASPGTTAQDIKRLASKARSRKTIINTMAMMEPAAEGPMKDLARLCHGQFTIINPDGSVKVVPMDPESEEKTAR